MDTLRPFDSALADARRWLVVVRRDLARVIADLRGDVPPPLVPRRRVAPTVGSTAGASLERAEPQRPERAHRLTVRRARAEAELRVAPGATILEACRAVGLSLAFSCAVGGCGTCRVRLLSGDVDLAEPNCLSPDERARGLILACVARPRGDVTIEVER